MSLSRATTLLFTLTSLTLGCGTTNTPADAAPSIDAASSLPDVSDVEPDSPVGTLDAPVARPDVTVDAPEASDAPAAPDARSPDAFVPRTTAEDVDLLLLVDNSNSMSEEQANLVALLPRLIDTLATGDRDRDGRRDFAPVRSLHVGVVTADMGAGPNTGVPTCPRGLGDDGILRARSRFGTAPCLASYPSGVFEFASATDDPAAFASTVSCVANVGTGGCGFEQQLEASLKALTPASATPWTRDGYSPPRFSSADGMPDSTAGHAEGANAGFIRADSVLAIVLLSDEEDCSVRDYGLFVTGDPRFMSVPLNLRCNTFGDPAMGIVQPVSRYVDGFLGLRRDPSLLVLSAIVGIPPEVEPLPGAAIDFSGILTNPNMVPRVNAMGTNLEPSCSSSAGVAYPPIRIVQLAAGLDAAGAGVGLTSICTTDFSGALDPIIARVATP